MKRFTKYLMALASSLLLLSCEEFQPVFTGKYENPKPYFETSYFDPSTVDGEVISIRELAKRFEAKVVENKIDDISKWAWVVSDNLWIHGRITTSDKLGNFYKSFYIQDEQDGPGIEIKIGRNALYNEYRIGQEVYIKLDGLAIGEYGWKNGNYGGEGMIQVGAEDPTGEYTTSYMEHQYVVNNHVFRCNPDDIKPFAPREVTVDQLPELDKPSPKEDTWKVRGITQADNNTIGSLITLKGLTYGDQIFALIYISGDESSKNSSNRVFLSKPTNPKEIIPNFDYTFGIKTWAMSKSKFKEYLYSGKWDSAKVGNSGQGTGQTVADIKEQLFKNANAYSVSQYFNMDERDIQVRTSGFSKFADLEIPADVFNGTKTIDLTGVLTVYQGSLQFVLTDENEFISALKK